MISFNSMVKLPDFPIMVKQENLTAHPLALQYHKSFLIPSIHSGTRPGMKNNHNTTYEEAPEMSAGCERELVADIHIHTYMPSSNPESAV
jgi:hypothetical protein